MVTCRRAVGRALLGPVRAVPGPGVVIVAVGCLAAAPEEEHGPRRRVVRGRGALPAARWTVGGGLLIPVRAVPGPRLRRTPLNTAPDQNDLLPIRVVRHGSVGLGGRAVGRSR